MNPGSHRSFAGALLAGLLVTLAAGPSAADPPPAPTADTPPPPSAAPPPPGYAPPPPGYAPPPPGYAPPPPGYALPPGAYYGPPPGYYPPELDKKGRPKRPPNVLPDQDEADVPGYHRETRASRKLLIAGASTFGAFYVAAVTTALIISLNNSINRICIIGPCSTPPPKTGHEALLVPLVGPLIGMGTMSPSGAGVFGLSVLAVGEVAGAAMFTASFFSQEKIWRINSAALRVVPAIAPDRAGLSVIGAF